MRHTVTITVEREPEIFMYKRFGGVAVVVRDDRQWTQRLRFEAFERSLAGFAMQTLIGNLGQPPADSHRAGR
jgi:hypothetical protein